MILGVITARGGSKGLPGKNLLPLGGVPLIGHTIRAARESELLSEFVVSTDDPKIAEVASALGANVPFCRPAHLATDDASHWRVVCHAVEQWENAAGDHVKTAVLLQPTSPLRRAADIDACLSRYQEVDADVCATVVVSHHSPYYNMVEMTPESSPFVRPLLPEMSRDIRRQTKPVVHATNGAVFVVRRSVLSTMENQFAIDRFAVVDMPSSRSVEIDTVEDLALAEYLLSREADGASD